MQRIFEVHRGIGGTGVVASLTVGEGGGVIGLRADMDALNIHEQAPQRDHASHIAGKIHAGGHDGHMAMVIRMQAVGAMRRGERGQLRVRVHP